MPSHVVSHEVSHEVLYERKWITFGVVNIETTWEHMDRRPNTRERVREKQSVSVCVCLCVVKGETGLYQK